MKDFVPAAPVTLSFTELGLVRDLVGLLTSLDESSCSDPGTLILLKTAAVRLRGLDRRVGVALGCDEP